MAVFFNGRLWTTPATMSVVDDSGMFNKNASVGNVLAIVGRADGGEPFKALRFGNAAEARAVLRGGEAVKAVEKAFDPSSQTAGPAEVVFVRVNPATQASLTLNDASGNPAIDLVSQGYGRFANQIAVKVEDGSIRGKKLTTRLGNDYYSADNIHRDALRVAYTGTGTAATISVTDTQVVLSVGGTAVATINLVDYPTVANLADRINGVADFSAEVLDNNHEKPALNGLDGLTNADLKAGPVTVTADLQACIDWFNGAAESLVTATRATGATGVPTNLPYTNLSGGSDGAVTMAEWQKAFEVLQGEDVQWVVPISPNPAIHAMTDTHCAFMSNVSLMERRAIVGTDVGTSDDDAILAAKALNSDRTSLVHLGFYDYDDKGKLTLYAPYVLAALLAGAFAGVNPGTALTNKAIKVRGLERKLRNPTDTDRLIKGGVLCVEDTPKGYKVVKSITTWLVNDNYNRVEISTGVACDFVSRNVRNILDDLRGSKASPATLAEAVSRVDSILRELARPEPMGPGVIVGDKANPPYRNIQASIDGDVMRVEFECSPVIPVNYIPIVVHAVPFSGSASA